MFVTAPTQDSVLDCWLSFVKAVIADRSLPCASRRNPHRSGRDSLPSSGSYHPAAVSSNVALPLGSSHFWLTKQVRPDDPTPSLHPHYRDFNTTTSWSGPLCPAHRYSHPRGSPPLWVSPLPSGRQVPTFTHEPDSGSRYLYAGRRQAVCRFLLDLSWYSVSYQFGRRLISFRTPHQ